MTIVLPENYHAKKALEARRIPCVSQYQALKQDIRALRIGILNIMPQAESYEFELLFPLGRTIIQIEPVWIRLKSHNYNSTSKEHLSKLYIPFDEAVEPKHLDGLILTGAPVEDLSFEQVHYWPEIMGIMAHAKKDIASTLGICWGGLALAKFLGIDKVPYREKVFGVFETKNINRYHRITGELDDVFWCPQSRHSGIPDDAIEKERDKGVVNLLAYSEEAGYVMFESKDQKFLAHLGHPEYDENRLIEEYIRDRKAGRTDVVRPRNIDINKPVNRWRGHCLEFFSQWTKFVYETTPF